jgi:excisionase family DNA binding protein
MSADEKDQRPGWEELPELLRVADVQELLGLGEDAVRQAIVAREIPSVRLGRLVLIPKARLRALLGYEGQP